MEHAVRCELRGNFTTPFCLGCPGSSRVSVGLVLLVMVLDFVFHSRLTFCTSRSKIPLLRLGFLLIVIRPLSSDCLLENLSRLYYHCIGLGFKLGHSCHQRFIAFIVVSVFSSHRSSVLAFVCLLTGSAVRKSHRFGYPMWQCFCFQIGFDLHINIYLRSI